uniref:Uncharacterized protein n=1 Tax=Haemonchus placei TaxID=6290 RepID=A0A0N4VY48_HAEPC
LSIINSSFGTILLLHPQKLKILIFDETSPIEVIRCPDNEYDLHFW